MRQMTHLLTWSSSIIIIVSVICSAAPQQVDNRAPLESEFQQRAELARQHLASITEQMQRKEKDVSLGVAPGIEMLEAQYITALTIRLAVCGNMESITMLGISGKFGLALFLQAHTVGRYSNEKNILALDLPFLNADFVRPRRS